MLTAVFCLSSVDFGLRMPLLHAGRQNKGSALAVFQVDGYGGKIRFGIMYIQVGPIIFKIFL